MALFGAPIAHEDHAQRACYAALHLREALTRYSDELRVGRGLDFTVRMGLNSGEVIVGKIGDDLRMDYTAQGHTVGLAARMEQIAAANSAMLSEDTAKLVEGYVELRPLGETSVKGVSDPVAVYQLEGIGAVRTRLDVSRARGFSKFVGRAQELATLEDALDAVICGEGQVVGVVADAGVGKSRLCLEFLEHCRARGVPVRETHCLAHGRAVPLMPILDLLRGIFEIDEHDSARISRNKIAGALVLLDRELEPSLPVMFDLLGVADPESPAPALSDDVRERRVFDIVRRFIAARSEREPAVVLFEDLHWIDSASESFIEHLVDVVPSTRTLFLVNFRPEYHSEWMQRSIYCQLPLRPLGDAEITELLLDLLGDDPSLGDLPARIRSRTEGNPFFIEEIIRSLAESGPLEGTRGAYRLAGTVDAIEIPSTVQPLLAARIDRLGEDSKHVLQAASVLGNELVEGVLGEMVDLGAEGLAESLRQLVAAEFLREISLYPEPEYTFVHPLTTEVAYRSQLSERRARLHKRAAQALEARLGEHRGERAAILAHHWELGGEKLTAARWHQVAAQRTTATNTRDSYQHWQKVRTLTDELSDSAEAEQLGTLARVQMFSSGARIARPEEEMERLFRECEAIVERSGSEEGRVQLLTGYSFYRLYVTGDARAAERDVGEALELAERMGALPLQLAARFAMCGTQIARSPARALQICEESLALIRRHPELARVELPIAYKPDVGFRFIRAVSLQMTGRLAAAEEAVAELQRLGHEDPEARSFAYSAGGWQSILSGDLARAEIDNTRFLEIAEASGNLSGTLVGLWQRGNLLLELGRSSEARFAFESNLRLHREKRIFRQLESEALVGIARAQLEGGEFEAARASLREALDLCEKKGVTVGEINAQQCLAEIELAQTGPAARARIEAALDRAETLSAETGQVIDLPRTHEIRARLAAAANDRAQQGGQLREALRLYEEMGAGGHARRLRDALARL